jgi:putative acetyltransferase
MLKIIQVNKEGEELDSIRQLFSEYEKELNEDLCFQSFEEELKDPLKKYGDSMGILLLAYWNNDVAGCVALTPLKDESVCEMKRLYVNPAHRKHGIGRLLVDELLKTAKEKGYTKIKLDTLQRLQPAIRLYESYGFVHTTAYYTNPISDVVYMEKILK